MGIFSVSSGSAGGNFKDNLFYNAKSGRFETSTRELDDDGKYASVKNPLPVPFRFLLDPDSFAQGYADAGKGKFDKIMRPLNEQPPNRPSDKWKARIAFDVVVVGVDDAEGDFNIRECGTMAGCVMTSIEKLAGEIMADRQDGKVPVVEATEPKPVANSHGTNYSPVFEVVEWIDAPPEFLGADGVERGDDRNKDEEEAVGVGAGDDDIIL